MSDNLGQIWSNANSQWESSRSNWQDGARQKFDNQFVEPLKKLGEDAKRASSDLQTAMDTGKRNIQTIGPKLSSLQADVSRLR